MSSKGFAPGWVARCPECPYEVDLESLGWVRLNAFSCGKPHSVHCPDCGRTRSMRIVHVDENGHPDQPLGLVLRKMFKLQLLIWGAILLVFTLGSVAILAVANALGIAATR